MKVLLSNWAADQIRQRSDPRNFINIEGLTIRKIRKSTSSEFKPPVITSWAKGWSWTELSPYVFKSLMTEDFPTPVSPQTIIDFSYGVSKLIKYFNPLVFAGRAPKC